MKAKEFVKKFGVEHAKLHIKNIEAVQIGDNHQDYINDMKRLVESHEIVESSSIIGLCAPENNYNQCLDYEKFGGLPMAKCELAEAIEYNSKFIEVILDNEITLIETERLKQAILDVESCQ